MEDLINKIYNHYPRGVDFLDNGININAVYLKTNESKILQNIIKNNIDNPKEEIDLIISSLKIKHNLELINCSRLNMGDRAYTLQFNKFHTRDKFYPICFVISLVGSYYYYYIVDIDINYENKFFPNGYNWENNNGRNKELESDKKFKDIIHDVSSQIELVLDYDLFPDELASEIIPDISFQEIKKGELTYFNAFFLNQFYCTA